MHLATSQCRISGKQERRSSSPVRRALLVLRLTSRRPAEKQERPTRVRKGDGLSPADSGTRRTPIRKDPVLRALVGLLIIIAIVLFLVKVAVAGGIIGAIALVLLILILLGRI